MDEVEDLQPICDPVQLDRIGELTNTGRHWRMTYIGCGHEQLLAPFGPGQVQQAVREVRRHYASCRMCRSEGVRPDPGFALTDWLYVRDGVQPEDKWHVVPDRGMLPPCSRALCGLAPDSRHGWRSVNANPHSLAVHDVCGSRR